MIKRTIHIGNPSYLSTKNEQLVISYPESEGKQPNVVPIEDIGLLIVEHQQITITNALLSKLLERNVAVVVCDPTHMPTGLFFNLDGNTLQSQKHQAQIGASVPLKKQLWQQTIIAKINNQATLLRTRGHNSGVLESWAEQVRSGDAGNLEAKAASYYWKRIFPDFLNFTRNREGAPPNNLLNYGYAILRAITARALTGSGLLPTLGIHHRNQYNAFCLADDIMEPYRPLVDLIVCQVVDMNGRFLDMTTAMKKELLSIPAVDVLLDGRKSPLMNAVSRTTSSLAQCYEGHQRKLLYPEMP